MCGRGLKHSGALSGHAAHRSPVVCGRGLKLLVVGRCRPVLAVARRVRAWIETRGGLELNPQGEVARRVRAWIETIAGSAACGEGRGVARRVRAWIETSGQGWGPRGIRSPVVCGRGLKRSSAVAFQAPAEVARRVWAWIETRSIRSLPARTMSPVVCGRGLKPGRPDQRHLQQQSPVVCGRGLKLAPGLDDRGVHRRPSCAGVD